MAEPDDSWDQIDWDQKIDVEQHEKEQKNTPVVASANFKLNFDEDNENYYEINQMRKKQEVASKRSNRKHKSRANYKEELPYSFKELVKIRSEDQFQNVIFEIFGNFGKFILTHEQDLSDESLIELFKIDVMLLEVPFMYHNKLLLERISKIESFWMQTIQLIEQFFESKWKDPKYLLLIDMKGLFENIESLMFFMIVQNLMKDELERIFGLLLTTINKYADREYFSVKKLQQILKVYNGLSNNLDMFEIIPSIHDLKNYPENLDKNIVHGEYPDVISYLKVQLPLLKEDFMCKLRSGFDHLKNIVNIDRVIRTHDATIFPNVQIKIEWHKLWNMNCPIILAQLNYHANFFNGQILCFTSSQKCEDLVVATVLKCGNIESIDQMKSVVIEIKKTENIEDIFEKEFFMVEPKSFFDPYYQVFGVLKSLNEHNFPFRSRILDMNREYHFPNYDHPDYYDYKNYSLRVDKIDDWIKCDLGLESMQVDAVYRGISNDFSVLVGPPGSGKTFIGLQLLDILLKNTDEKILILTQTNNALDKFLIGCLQFTDKIARLGGQCKNETIEPYIASTNVPYESRSYLKKLQAQQGDTVTDLMEANEDLAKVFQQISLHYRLSEEINQLNSYCNIKEKRVYGMTTSYAAHNGAINKLLKPGIVIIEEASEILESHILASLTKETKHVIMIGDHHQLRPQTNSYNLQRNFDFNISLFERLIFNKYSYVSLDVQRRMRPEFCDLVRETIYKDLKDGPNVKSYPNVKGMSKNFFVLNHDFPESISETSKENPFEVDFISNLYQKLLDFGNDSSEIVILTPYAAQAKKFKLKLRELSLPRVRVAILDAYQGEESNIILLSLVRSNKTNDIGFLAMENRISVILSRAKLGFYICGNIKCFANSSRVWRKIKDIFIRHKVIENSIPRDFGI
ncbi:NFX1-type zinc finger-containing protein 1 [Chironomus tepperi]|uniref:NFX1-type zinc finger-containing protein 1 n=1 Tax=Chironomus tepperi TaxID=113505 RepID=UPI00391FADCE